MQFMSAQLKRCDLEYRILVVNYLYLQSIRKKVAMSKLPPDLLGRLGAKVGHNGVGVSYLIVSEPEDKGKTMRVKKALSRIISNVKNLDVFGNIPKKTKRGGKADKEEETHGSNFSETQEALDQIGLDRKDLIKMRSLEHFQ